MMRQQRQDVCVESIERSISKTNEQYAIDNAISTVGTAVRHCERIEATGSKAKATSNYEVAFALLVL